MATTQTPRPGKRLDSSGNQSSPMYADPVEKKACEQSSLFFRWAGFMAVGLALLWVGGRLG